MLTVIPRVSGEWTFNGSNTLSGRT